MNGHPEEVSSAAPRSSLFWFWLAYAQVAALLGAFSILVLLTNFFELGLQGVVNGATEVWTSYIRPAVGYPLQWLIDQLPPAMHFHVPTVAKDYLSVGIVSFASMARALQLGRTHMNGSVTLVLAIGNVFFWPVFVLLTYPFAVVSVWNYLFGVRESLDAGTAEMFVVWLSPLIYLGLLFAANAWLV